MSAIKVFKYWVSVACPSGASAAARVATSHVSHWTSGGFSTLGASCRALKNSSLHILFAVLALTALPAWADGELDTSFGSKGVVKIAFPNSSRGYLRDAAVVNGVIEAAGFEPEFWHRGGTSVCPSPFPSLFIVRLSLDGSLIGTPSTIPQQAIECPTDLFVDPATGDIFVKGYDASNDKGVIGRFDSTGGVAPTYLYPGPTYSCDSRAFLDSQARFVAACYQRGEFGIQKVTVLRLSGQAGQLVGGFLTSSQLTGNVGMHPSAIVQDVSSGAYYVGGEGMVIRLDADSGSLDMSYGNAGVAAVASGAPHGITLDGSGKVVVGGGGDMDIGLVEPGYLARLDSTGAPDAGFGTKGVVQNLSDSIIDLRTDDSRAYALGFTSELLRFQVNGAPDVTFSSSSNVQALNGAGSRWQSMQFVDSSRSSVYLIGGATCQSSCASAATTAVIAKVTLVSALSAGMTATILNSSATTIPMGQSVTLTATVLGANPTGTMTFKDGATTLKTANLTSGSVSYSTSSLSLGTHSLTAAYSGNSGNAASTSQPVSETISPAISTTALAASSATISSGQSVTFTATVTGTNPTGTVTFSDGSTQMTLGTVSLASGRASYSTSALSVGTHLISAQYSGDSNNAASGSMGVTETVNAMTSGGGGGGGAFTGLELCGMLLLCLWRAFVGLSRRVPLPLLIEKFQHGENLTPLQRL
jgi:hypothetical protein